MVRKSSTQESLILAFEILKRIPRHQKITASEIHQQLIGLGIYRDIRTIQRNLDVLSQHFDIERDTRSKPFGYSWTTERSPFAASNLSAQESLLLNLAEQHLKQILPRNMLSSLESHFYEANYNLKFGTANKKERNWRDKVRVVRESMPLLPPEINPVVFDAVSEALFEDRLLDIEFYNADLKARNATVMPLGLAQQGVRLYLICRFESFSNERTLAIHRISKAKVSTFGFARPEDFSLSKYESDGRFGYGEGEKCLLSFHIEKKAGLHLLETPLSKDQKVEELVSHYKISATVVDSLLLDRWLRSFGGDVTNITKERTNNVYSTLN